MTKSFNFNNFNYIINEAICMPIDDYYLSYCHLCLTNELNF